MAIVKRLSALFLTLIMIISLAGCADTRIAAVIDGYEIKAGIYIYYSYMTYTEAVDKVSAQSDIDTTDEKALKKAKIGDTLIKDWIIDETTKRLQQFVGIEKKFDELNLSLTEDELDEIEAALEYQMEYSGEMFTENGISEESVKDILTNSYKSQKVFEYFYGIDGTEGVTEDILKDYYIENNARVKIINVQLKDGLGTPLEGDNKEIVIDMAKDYYDRLQYGEDIDDLIEEYYYYAQSIAEEANAGTPVEDYIKPTEYNPEETTTVEETEEFNELSNENDVETTTDEDISDDEPTETTTEYPYANEQIIQRVTTDEENNDEDSEGETTLYYNPSKKSNEAIFNEAEIGEPILVEDEESYYIILKLDIEERMTEDDLWNENTISNLQYELHYEDFEDMLNEWIKDYVTEKNEAAYDRYDPFEFKS